MAWINWLLKPKCMLIYILFWNFLCCVKIWCYNIYIYILERLGRMHENKTFLFLFYFFDDLTKTGYFNTGFVSLQYKNTKRYWSKCNNIFAKNHRFFEIILWRKFFQTGQTRPKRKLGRDQPKINWGLISTGLDSAQQHGLGWGSSPKQAWTGTAERACKKIFMHSARSACKKMNSKTR